MNKIKDIQEDFWFTLLRKGDLRKFWKPQIEIVFMLKGKGQIYFANMKKSYTVREEDIFVINSFESITFAVNYIQSHYRENITLDDLAKQTFLSRTYISRSFKKYFGISFTDCVTILRMTYASKMLRGKNTISEVALESGFPNVNAMIIAFKRYKGVTPGEYRKNQEDAARKEQGKEFLRDEEREELASLMKYLTEKVETEPCRKSCVMFRKRLALIISVLRELWMMTCVLLEPI